MRTNSFMQSLIKTVMSVFLAMILLLSVFPEKAYASTYSDTVGISEDTYETLSKASTKYNNVDYGQKDGFNPLYYFLNYSDLRAAFGADPYKLVQHWAMYGRNEHRVCNKLLDRGAQSFSSKNEYVVPSYQKTKTKKDGMTVIPNEIHSNGGMNRRQETEARSIAYQIAQDVYKQVNDKGSGTQIEMVTYATGIVRAYLDLGTETTTGKLYRTAYGVFVAHEYSSAGATRALGLVLDYLDQLCMNNATEKKPYTPLKWVHVNANTWNDQWCQIVCDNHEAYADAISGQAGYGKNPKDGGKKQDVQSYYKYAGENDLVNTNPPLVDGEYKITENKPKNENSSSGKLDSYYDKYNKK